MGDVRLAGHVVDVLDGRVPLRVGHADLVGRDRAHHEGGLGFSEGSAEVHKPGLWQLVHADVVLCGVVFGLGPQGGCSVGHQDVAAAVGHAALGLSQSKVRVQLLEELPLADIDRVPAGWVDSTGQPAFLSLQGERVAGVLGNGLHVAALGW